MPENAKEIFKTIQEEIDSKPKDNKIDKEFTDQILLENIQKQKSILGDVVIDLKETLEAISRTEYAQDPEIAEMKKSLNAYISDANALLQNIGGGTTSTTNNNNNIWSEINLPPPGLPGGGWGNNERFEEGISLSPVFEDRGNTKTMQLNTRLWKTTDSWNQVSGGVWVTRVETTDGQTAHQITGNFKINTGTSTANLIKTKERQAVIEDKAQDARETLAREDVVESTKEKEEAKNIFLASQKKLDAFLSEKGITLTTKDLLKDDTEAILNGEETPRENISRQLEAIPSDKKKFESLLAQMNSDKARLQSFNKPGEGKR